KAFISLAKNMVLAKDGGNVLFMGYYKRYINFDNNVIFQSTATTWRIFLAQYGICNTTALPVISSTNTTFCEGDSVVLTSSPATSYLWSTGDTTSQITIHTPGDYHVFAIENSECYAKSNDLSIEQLPLPIISVLQSNETLSASGSGTFQWIDCATNTEITNETGTTFTPSVSGTYAVIVTSAEGCSKSSDCIALVIAGTESDNRGNAITIFPNPATSEITLKSSTVLNSIVICNVLGEMVMQTENKIFNVSHLSSGLYFINATTSSGTFGGKFVKE
ncbi:MAG: T9SS type A sorting domain-containing protein, partial [Chitinophagaceae bacterium]